MGRSGVFRKGAPYRVYRVAMATLLRDLTVDQFIERYCGGMQPTPGQGRAISALLEDQNTEFWLGGRGGGKTTVRRWIVEYLMDLEEEESRGWRQWRLVEVEGGYITYSGPDDEPPEACFECPVYPCRVVADTRELLTEHVDRGHGGEAPFGRDNDNNVLTREDHHRLVVEAGPLDPPAFGSTRDPGRRATGRIDL